MQHGLIVLSVINEGVRVDLSICVLLLSAAELLQITRVITQCHSYCAPARAALQQPNSGTCHPETDCSSHAEHTGSAYHSMTQFCFSPLDVEV